MSQPASLTVKVKIFCHIYVAQMRLKRQDDDITMLGKNPMTSMAHLNSPMRGHPQRMQHAYNSPQSKATATATANYLINHHVSCSWSRVWEIMTSCFESCLIWRHCFVFQGSRSAAIQYQQNQVHNRQDQIAKLERKNRCADASSYYFLCRSSHC